MAVFKMLKQDDLGLACQCHIDVLQEKFFHGRIGIDAQIDLFDLVRL